MSTWNEILDFLDDDDSTWLLQAGQEQTLQAGQVLVREGDQSDKMFFIIRGVFDVTLVGRENDPIRAMAAGEVVGEIAFVTGEVRSATVTAREEAEVLGIDHTLLTDRLESDPLFGRRFFEGLCRIACQRLASFPISGRGDADVEDGIAEAALRKQIDSFGELLHQAEVKAGNSGGEVSSQDILVITDTFVRLHESFNQLVYGGEMTSQARDRLGAIAQKGFLSILQLTRTAERFYSKPRGYAGDFLTIEMIYEDKEGGTGLLGPVIDRCFLDSPAARAVQNRRGLLLREILDTVKNSASAKRPARVMSIACGPAREMFDSYETLEDPASLETTLLDVDAEAHRFVKERLASAGLDDFVSMKNENVLYVAIGRQKMELPPQDLIYSIGLIDYFSDKTVIRLLNYAHGALAPGGRLILGNFHPRNSSRAFMDYILEWRLIHRTEEDMNRLFVNSAFGKSCDRILFEDQGINLFAECVKD